jgi:hypothetical protein
MLRCFLIAAAAAAVSSTQEGCLCEPKESHSTKETWYDDIGPDTIDTLTGEASAGAHMLTRAPLFRTGGMISEFCPCSIYTLQKLNEKVIRPALAKLLPSNFFRFFRFVRCDPSTRTMCNTLDLVLALVRALVPALAVCVVCAGP